MFALNPMLHERFEMIAAMLAEPRHESIALPLDVRLRLAVFCGYRARVTGAYGGWYLRLTAHERSEGVNTAASIAFRPLAWHLAYPDLPNEPPTVFGSLLDVEGWADVSHWVGVDPQTVVPVLKALGEGLPVVDLPDRHPKDGSRWTWLLNSEICPTIDADTDPARSSNYPRRTANPQR